MKKNILLVSIFTLLIFQSCKNKTERKQKEITNKVIISDSINNSNHKAEIVTANYEFVSYNDDGDFTTLIAKRGKDTAAFINDNIDDRNLLHGDECEIKSKIDTIYIPGDGETPALAEVIISIKKIKDGQVSKFRKNYSSELKYHWSQDNNYSDDYLNKIYLLAEYYIASSKNELIKIAIQKNEQIEYSIEKQIRNDISYLALGIGHTFEHRFTIMQWIYIDSENHKIYEYDLANDKLLEFK